MLILTNNVVPKADGAKGDEGKVEAFAEAPALHSAEGHGREDEDHQCPQDQAQSQAQDLQELGEGAWPEFSWRTSGLRGGVGRPGSQ